jgi:predicted negative regulator of RcsB-dependent stress response
MGIADDAKAAARRKAQDLLSRKKVDVERVETEAKRRQNEDSKTARLKALRLAKEAAEKGQHAAAGPRILRKKRVPDR